MLPVSCTRRSRRSLLSAHCPTETTQSEPNVELSRAERFCRSGVGAKLLGRRVAAVPQPAGRKLCRSAIWKSNWGSRCSIATAAASMSEAGKVLLPLAQEALRHVKRIEETMWVCAASDGRAVGGVQHDGRQVYPASSRCGLSATLPRVRVTVNVMSRRAAIEWLLAAEPRSQWFRRSRRKTTSNMPPSWRIAWCVLVPAEHPWADGRTVTPGDLLTEAVYPAGTVARHPTRCWPKGLQAVWLEGRPASNRADAGNTEAIEMSVEAGIGIVFGRAWRPARAWPWGRSLKCRWLDMDRRRNIYMLRYNRPATSPLQQTFGALRCSRRTRSCGNCR